MTMTAARGERRSVAVRVSGNLIVIGHTRERPSNPEFDSYINTAAAVQAEHGEQMRILVLTDGGGPDEAQRKALAARVDISALPAAVVSDAASVRFIVSAFAFLDRKIQTFAPSDLPGIMRHLGLPAERQPEVRSLAMAVRDELGGLRVVDAMLGRPRADGPFV